MFTENHDPIVEHEISDDPFDQETDELEAFLSELKDDGAEPALPDENFLTKSAKEKLRRFLAR